MLSRAPVLTRRFVGAVYGVWPARDERKPFTLEVCLGELIASIESASPRETRQMQSVLRKVLIEQAGTREALDALGVGFAQSRRLWFAARRNFTDRLQALSDQLVDVQRRLPP